MNIKNMLQSILKLKKKRDGSTSDKFKYIITELPGRYSAHHVTAFSAQMAYFLVMSIFPALILLIGVLGRLSIEYSWDISGYVNLIPREASFILQEYIKGLLVEDGGALLSVSGVFMIYSASRGVNSLMRSLNMAYGIPEDRGFVRVKLLGVFYTIMLFVSIIIALAIPNMGKGFFEFLSVYLPIPVVVTDLSSILGLGIYLITTNLVIGSLYAFLPNKRVAFKQVIPGTVFAITGWWVISKGFSYFVSNFSNLSVVYGSLTAVIILMIWLYLSSTIIMIGGEINSLLIDYKNKK